MLKQRERSKLDPFNAIARGVHALSLSELGDDAEAVKEAERAVQLAPMDSRGSPQPRDCSEAH